MKKILLIILLIFNFNITKLFAQIHFSAGLHGGFNFTSLSSFPLELAQQRNQGAWQIGAGIQEFGNRYISSSQTTYSRTNWEINGLGGLHTQLGFGDAMRVFLKTGVDFTQKSGNIKTNDSQYPWDVYANILAFNTVDVPILLGFSTHDQASGTEFRFYGGMVFSHVNQSFQQYRKSNLSWAIPLIPISLGTSIIWMPPKIETDVKRDFNKTKAAFQSFKVGIGFSTRINDNTNFDVDLAYERTVENILIRPESKIFIDGVYLSLGFSFGTID